MHLMHPCVPIYVYPTYGVGKMRAQEKQMDQVVVHTYFFGLRSDIRVNRIEKTAATER
jgi:hypothetical protein